MKKTITLATVCVLTAASLCGCADQPARSSDLRRIADEYVARTEQSETQSPTDDYTRDINIKIDGYTVDEFFGLKDRRSDISGVRRKFMSEYIGTYTVEYIHVPYGVDRDDTLDFNLTLNDDNTFTMKVVSEGVEAEHYGRWYARRHQITMYYDEPIDPTKHNVYVADSMYGELLPDGKIMVYENCHTIVLSRPQAVLYEK